MTGIKDRGVLVIGNGRGIHSMQASVLKTCTELILVILACGRIKCLNQKYFPCLFNILRVLLIITFNKHMFNVLSFSHFNKIFFITVQSISNSQKHKKTLQEIINLLRFLKLHRCLKYTNLFGNKIHSQQKLPKMDSNQSW